MRTRVMIAAFSLVVGAAALSACGSRQEAPPAEEQVVAEADAPNDTEAESPEAAIPVADPQAAAPTLEGTAWKLVQLGDEHVIPEGPQGEPSLTLDAASMGATGTGGCNRYTGTYTVDHDAGTLGFSPLAATRMMCPEGMDTEAAFLAAMGEVQAFALTDEGNLELLGAEGALVARFEPGS